MTALESLDGVAVRRWCGVAAEALARAREQIDALNVFPVADRDTGTNLHLTMLSGVTALDGLPESAEPSEVWRALAQGVLYGAQGNSGVIVSQFLRGLAEVCGPASPCDGGAVGRGLAHAARLSHAAVGEPVEGTVLTVAFAGAASAAAAGNGLAAVTRAAAHGARRALARTTAQLDVLARNGVVDAGAAGLCVLFDALAAVVTGTFPESFTVPAAATLPAVGHRGPTDPPVGHRGPADPPVGHAAGYEVMYLLEAAEDAVARLRERLRGLGDSLVVVGGEDVWNVHVHVADVGAAIEAGLAAGRPHRIRVTYLGTPEHVGQPPPGAAAPDQVTAVSGGASGVSGGASGVSDVGVAAPARPGPGGAAGVRPGGTARPGPGGAVVVVTAGEGIAALCERAGAVVMRRNHERAPRPAEVLDMVRRAATQSGRVVILPDDPGVADVCAAVAAHARDEGIVVAVAPSRTAVQCLAALAVHDPARGFEDDAAAMAEAADATRWGRVTWAAEETGRGTGAHGDAAGFVGGDVTVSGVDATTAAIAVAGRLLAAGGELVTLVAGAAPHPHPHPHPHPRPHPHPHGGAYTGSEIAAELAAHLTATRPDLEIIIHDGGEAGYLLLIGVE